MPVVRVALVIIGCVVSLWVVPVVLAGAAVLFAAPFIAAPVEWEKVAFLSAAPAGLLGIVGAWLRVLVPSAKYHQSRRLRIFTSCALLAGTTAAFLMSVVSAISGKGMFAAFLGIIVLLGIFLLLATLGERFDET